MKARATSGKHGRRTPQRCDSLSRVKGGGRRPIRPTVAGMGCDVRRTTARALARAEPNSLRNVTFGGNGLISKMRALIAATVATAVFSASIPTDVQVFNPFSALPGMPSLGDGDGGSAAARAIILRHRHVDHTATTERARAGEPRSSFAPSSMSGSASWKTSGKTGKTASYTKVGKAQTVGNQKCQKVQEKITLPSGEQGVSEENVCSTLE